MRHLLKEYKHDFNKIEKNWTIRRNKLFQKIK
jgi:hypothetical protein